MDTSLVSVIIPVYNTEKYVEEAIRSIMEQTLHYLEIIVINDGSTDNSLLILNKLAEEDSRIKIHTQVNHGLSAARNTGIKLSTGKYIYFMDSDDYLESEALEACLLKCEYENLDFVFFDADILNIPLNKNINLHYNRKHLTNENYVYNGIQIFSLLVKDKCYSPSACLNFINKTILSEKQLEFLPGIIHEDQLFTTLLYLQSNRIACIHREFFKRRIRENSITTCNFSMRNMESYFIIIDHLLLFASNNQVTKKILYIYISDMLNAAIRLSYKMPIRDRLYILKRTFIKYCKFTTIKSLFILLFKPFLKQ